MNRKGPSPSSGFSYSYPALLPNLVIRLTCTRGVEHENGISDLNPPISKQKSYRVGNFPKYKLMFPLCSPLAIAGCPIGPLDCGLPNLLPTAGIAFRKEIPAFGNGTAVCPARLGGGVLGVKTCTKVGESRCWSTIAVIGPSDVISSSQRTPE